MEQYIVSYKDSLELFDDARERKRREGSDYAKARQCLNYAEDNLIGEDSDKVKAARTLIEIAKMYLDM